MARATDGFAGLGLGLFTGLLVGLSATPVVAGVVAALTAVLGGFFGLAGNRLAADPVRIGSFGCAAVLGLALGLVVRAQDLAAPSVADEVRRLTAAGYPPPIAQDIVAFRRYGILPTGRQVGPPPREGSALFAGEAELCGRLQTLPGAAQQRLLTEVAQGTASSPALRALAVALEGAPGRVPDAVKALCGG